MGVEEFIEGLGASERIPVGKAGALSAVEALSTRDWYDRRREGLMLAEGSWYFSSESDPRWNRNGRGRVGMFMTLEACSPAKDALDRLILELEESPPDDLVFGYMKD